MIEGGLWLHEHKELIQDEKSSTELAEMWGSKMNEKQIFDWVHGLSDSKLNAIRMAADLERDSRNKQ